MKKKKSLWLVLGIALLFVAAFIIFKPTGFYLADFPYEEMFGEYKIVVDADPEMRDTIEHYTGHQFNAFKVQDEKLYMGHGTGEGTCYAGDLEVHTGLIYTFDNIDFRDVQEIRFLGPLSVSASDWNCEDGSRGTKFILQLTDGENIVGMKTYHVNAHSIDCLQISKSDTDGDIIIEERDVAGSYSLRSLEDDPVIFYTDELDPSKEWKLQARMYTSGGCRTGTGGSASWTIDQISLQGGTPPPEGFDKTALIVAGTFIVVAIAFLFVALRKK